jgi:hypothetical protein
MNIFKLTLLTGFCAVAFSGCQVAKTTGKIAALPFKGVYKTTEFAGKTVYKTGELAGSSVYYTGKYAGKGIYGTGKMAGKAVIGTGKGLYYIGTVPVKITDKALDTTAKVLTVTTQAIDVSGKVITTARTIQSVELEAELAAIKGATNILNVIVDVIT